MIDTSDEELGLERFRQAVHGLYLASLPDPVVEELATHDLLGDAIVEVPEAVEVLVAARVDRLLKLHAVASTLNRKPTLAEHRQDLAKALEVDDPDRGLTFLADRLAQFAAEAEAQGGGLSPDRWDLFLSAIAEPRDDRAVVNKPGCNDDETVPTPAGNAATIKSRFWTDLPVDQLAGFVDPRRWAICGRPFWKQMALVAGTETRFSRSGVEGYAADFEEIVDLPVIGEVAVYLRVEYGVEARAGQPPSHVYANYELAAGYPTRDVTFDSGWLCATANTLGPEGEATLVEGLKAIRFADDFLNQFPDLACDGGWVYLMINMALQCSGVPGAVTGASEVPPPAHALGMAAATDGIGEAIDDWVRYAGESLQSHGQYAKSAIDRILGPRLDPRWVNDLLDMAPGAVGTTKATLAAWRRILTELAERGGQR
ncbi:MAG: hypothetical protein ACRD07_10375 [Acidimicrobiales bacterium]